MARQFAFLIAATFLAGMATPSQSQETPDWLRDRQTAFAHWQDAQAKVAALANQPAEKTLASVHPQEFVASPAVFKADGAFAEVWDAPEAPHMVVVTPGRFLMGTPAEEAGHTAFEGSRHEVAISSPFAIGKYDVTFDEWDVCVTEGGCKSYRPGDEGWGRRDRPVINVSWADAEDYVTWLSKKAGKTYRLPTEAEWEYAARAGSPAAYSWGALASHEEANYGRDDCCGGAMSGKDQYFNTSPVGAFPANAYGLYDMNGNVFQLVQDCWMPNYASSPADGRAVDRDGCGLRIIRGGSWSSTPAFMREGARIWVPGGARMNIVGFRVARSM
ncbi:MAG TPA: formylglycine-generating enzyme family protein [Rhizomicrobium sp.]|jgi:formylglycine-generating enzyme required for sulfatase activity